MNGHFTGDQKHLDHFVRTYEKKILYAFLPFVPPWMSTVHLTLMTIVWSGLIIFFGFLAKENINWLWGFSACIILQYITDMLDGEVGRQRNEGLIKWGFYADHFLDYTFLCSIIIGYSFLLPSSYALLVLICLALTGGFMVHTFLDFSITNDFKISFNRFGVSEMRIMLIMLNMILIFAGKELFATIFPTFVSISFMALCFVVWQSQKIYRKMDLGKCENSTHRPPSAI